MLFTTYPNSGPALTHSSRWVLWTSWIIYESTTHLQKNSHRERYVIGHTSPLKPIPGFLVRAGGQAVHGFMSRTPQSTATAPLNRAGVKQVVLELSRPELESLR